MTKDEQRSAPPRLTSINIKGFKCFRDFSASFEPLEVFVGANGTGKTSLFEFLRFIREGTRERIPPEIVPGAIGQEIFYRPGDDEFSWITDGFFYGHHKSSFSGKLLGPKGKVRSPEEKLTIFISGEEKILLDTSIREYRIHGNRQAGLLVGNKEFNELGIKYGNYPDNPFLPTIYFYFNSWRFFSSFKINREKIRRTIPIEQAPELHEDCGNLSSLLFSLFTEHPSSFEELKRNLKLVIPGFKGLSVKARGGPGEVIALWQEQGMDTELTLADLSDGILNLLCWITLCLHPDPPFLVCIDEPEVGVHPRALPLLAGLFQKLSERTQVFIATHSSYLLSRFPVENVTVMKKEGGEVVARKVKDSKALMANLEEFGTGELEAMHQSDELEALS